MIIDYSTILKPTIQHASAEELKGTMARLAAMTKECGVTIITAKSPDQTPDEVVKQRIQQADPMLVHVKILKNRTHTHGSMSYKLSDIVNRYLS